MPKGIESKVSLKKFNSMHSVDQDQQENLFDKNFVTKLEIKVEPTVIQATVGSMLDAFQIKAEEFIQDSCLEKLSKDVKQEIEEDGPQISHLLNEDIDVKTEDLENLKSDLFSNTSEEEYSSSCKVKVKEKEVESFSERINISKEQKCIKSSNIQISVHTSDKKFLLKPKKSLECEVCDLTFAKNQEFVRHMKMHENVNGCKFCACTFTLKGSLTVHLRRHTGERPYKCSYCPKAFSASGSLSLHHRIHTNDRPYTCDICGKSFARNSLLTSHRKKTHTKDRPYKCSYCPKAYGTPGQLRSHHRYHTNERPHTCDTCGKAFTEDHALKRHMKSHELLYKCSYCAAAFKYSYNRVEHYRNHPNHRPYTCDTCGKLFSKNYMLKNHIKTHADVTDDLP